MLAGLENTGWAVTQALSSTFVGVLLDWGNCEQEGAVGPMSAEDLASCDTAWRTAFGLAAALYVGQAVVFTIWGSSTPLRMDSLAAVDVSVKSPSEGVNGSRIDAEL